jgi:hypothetical protein
MMVTRSPLFCPISRPWTRVVHHREHVLEPAVLLAHQVADGALVVAVRHHARRARVDAHLVLDRDAAQVVSLPGAAVRLHQELGHDEQRDALHAFRRVGGAREHQVHDVVAHVVLAGRDENLFAGDAETAVAIRRRLRAQEPEVRAAVRFRQTHRARPGSPDHGRQIGLLLLRGAVLANTRDRTVRQTGVHAERVVRRSDHLGDHELQGHGQFLPAVLRVARHATEARLVVLLVRVFEAFRHAHPLLTPVAPFLVTGTVQRRDDGLHQLRRLVEHGVDDLTAQVGPTRDLRVVLLDLEKVVEDEAHVAQGGFVLRHSSWVLPQVVRASALSGLHFT